MLKAKEKTMNTSKRKKLSSMKYLLGQERPVGSCFPTDGNVSVEEDRGSAGVEERVLEQGEAMRSLGGAEEFALKGSPEIPS